MKKKIITISGTPGSGKSTTADLVAEKLSWQRFSSGDYARSVAAERGLTLAELLEQAENDPSIDHDIDAKNKEYSDKSEVVIDSRLAFHFIPNSFDVYLNLDLETAASRIFDDITEARKESGEAADSVEEVQQQIEGRLKGEKRRYKELYDVDYTDRDHYDLVVDTTDYGISEVAEKIIEGYEEWYDEKSVEEDK